MNQKKKFAFSGAFAALILVAVVGFTLFNSSNIAHAEAQELVKRSYVTASRLTPELRSRLEGVIEASIEETLAEAKNAPDLKVISKEEWPTMKPASLAIEAATEDHGVAKPYPEETLETKDVLPAGPTGDDVLKNTFPTAVDISKNGDGIDIKIPEAVKFMSYTDKTGKKIIIGLDKDDTLVFKGLPSIK